MFNLFIQKLYKIILKRLKLYYFVKIIFSLKWVIKEIHLLIHKRKFGGKFEFIIEYKEKIKYKTCWHVT